MSSANKRETLFSRGVSAARAVYGTEGLYICPICECRFDKLALDRGELTLEHVPPRVLGGKGIILTCASCNNTAGHSIEADVARRAELDQFVEVFLQKRVGAAGRAIIEIDGTPICVDVHYDGATTTFKVLGGSNNPATIECVSSYLKNLAEQGKGHGEKIKVTAGARYHRRRALVGDLRCAFLACAAAFGYRFALSPVLDSVRAQIREPNETILPQWLIQAPGDSPYQIRVSEPNGLVVVSYKDRSIMLPWPSREDDRYAQIAERMANGGKMRVTAKEIAWPTFFHASLDINGA